MKADVTSNHLSGSRRFALLVLTVILANGYSGWTSRFFYVAFVSALVVPKAGIKVGNVPLPLSLLLVAIALLTISMGRGAAVRRRHAVPIGVFVLFWAGYVILRDLASGVSIIGLITIVSWLTIPFLALTLVARFFGQGAQISQRFVQGCVRGAWLLAIYALIQLLGGVEAVSVPGVTIALGDSLEAKPLLFQTLAGVAGTKYPSTYQNGNLVGAVAAVGAALALVAATSRRDFKSPWSWALLPMASLVILSGSRSAVLALAAVALLFLARLFLARLHSARALHLLALGALAVVAVVSLDAGLRSRLAPSDLLDIQGAGRAEAWRTALAHLSATDLLFGTTSWGTGGVPLQEGWVGLLQQVGVVGAVLLTVFVALTWKDAGVENRTTVGLPIIVFVLLDSSYQGYPVLLLALLMPVLLGPRADSKIKPARVVDGASPIRKITKNDSIRGPGSSPATLPGRVPT